MELCEAVETPVVCACVGGTVVMQRGIVGLCCVFTLENSLIGGSAWAEGVQDGGDAGQRWRVFVRTNKLIETVADKKRNK